MKPWRPLRGVRRRIRRRAIDLGLIDPAKGDRHLLVGPTESFEMKRSFQIAFLKSRGLVEQHRVLDIGCGTLRGGIPIIRYLETGSYCGLDVRERVLEEGRQEIEENGLGHKKPLLMTIEQAKAGIEGRGFDWIWVFNVMIHMHDPILRETMSLIAQNLAPDGTCYASVNLGKNSTRGDWQGFPSVLRPLLFYEDVAAEVKLQADVLGTLDSFGYEAQQGVRSNLVMLSFTRSAGPRASVI